MPFLCLLACAPDESAGLTESSTGTETTEATETTGTDGTADALCPAGRCTPGMLLIEPELVQDILAQPEANDWRVLDLRPYQGYVAGHLPDARWLDPDLLRDEVDGVSGQVASMEVVAELLATRKINYTTEVLAVDDGTGLAAARTIWTLGHYGLRGRVLHGGHPGWVAAGGEISTDIPPDYLGNPPNLGIQSGLRVDATWVQDHLTDASVTFVDARTPEEYAAGRIPGAYLQPWTATKSGSRFLPPDELRSLYEASGALPTPSPEQTLVAYCQTGTRASVTWLTLKLLGYANVRIYDGSWEEWSTIPDAPQEP
ncbi:MAG: sulfurtransferase [Nannocystaceae bacterium]